ncbi:MAG: hypothetical protein H0V61_08350, partial [Chitinophagales bacterium]|nr:hypothetical protein [Chitinophagales bacterium]
MKNIFHLCLIIVACFLYQLKVSAQIWCETNATPVEQLISAVCNTTSNYTPDDEHPDFRPIVYLLVNIHFFQKQDGSGNFAETSDGNGNSYPTGYDYAELLIGAANDRLEENQQMFLPPGNNTPVKPTQYRFVLWGISINESNVQGDNGIYFHQVPDGDYFYNGTLSGWKDSYSVNGDQVIDVWLCATLGGSCGGFAEGVGTGDETKITDPWYSHVNGGCGFWNFGRLLNHEIGHLLGNCHSFYSFNICNDIDPVNECNNPGYTNSSCGGPSSCDNWGSGSNNFMGYNDNQSAWTPCQLGIIHEYLTNSLPSYVDRNYICNYDGAKTITINTGESFVWNASRHLQGD